MVAFVSLSARMALLKPGATECQLAVNTPGVKSRAIWLTNRAISYTSAGGVPVPGTLAELRKWTKVR